MRQGGEVRAQAEAWRDLVTVTEKESLAWATGVRWTPLHNMPYLDPVEYVLLGFMHNFLKGILQHQLRVLWRIGRSKAAMKETTEMDSSELSDDSD